MSGWDDFIKEINSGTGQQANKPPAAPSATQTSTQSSGGWDDFMKRINGESAPAAEPQTTVLPQATAQPEPEQKPVANWDFRSILSGGNDPFTRMTEERKANRQAEQPQAAQNEPFQLRMAKQQATESADKKLSAVDLLQMASGKTPLAEIEQRTHAKAEERRAEKAGTNEPFQLRLAKMDAAGELPKQQMRPLTPAEQMEANRQRLRADNLAQMTQGAEGKNTTRNGEWVRDDAEAARAIDRIFGVDRTQVTGGKTNWGKLVLGNYVKGMYQWANNFWKTANMVLDEPAQGIHDFGTTAINSVIETLNDIPGVNIKELEYGDNFVRQLYNISNAEVAAQRDYFAANANTSRAAQLIDRFGTETVAAVPFALEALFVAGAKAPQLIGNTTKDLRYLSSINGGKGIEVVGAELREGIEGLARNPQFWSSYLQTAGGSYEEALQDGMDEGQAAIYALTNGAMNAAIEVGGIDEALGGIQNMTNRKNGGNILREALLAGGQELGEEIEQGITGRGLKAMSGQDVPLVSFDKNDTRAIINPWTAAEEGIGGFVVGSFLGGGQTAISNIGTRAASAATQAAENAAQEAAQQAAPAVAETTPQNAAESPASEGETPAPAAAETAPTTAEEVFTGESGLTYTTEQAAALSALSNDALITAAEASYPLPYNRLGVTEEQAAALRNAGLLQTETTETGDTYEHINDAAIYDERARRRKAGRESSTAETAPTGESERLNRASVVGETEAAQTTPEQTAMQPTTAAEPTTAAAGIAPVEQSGENGTVTGEEIALPGMKRSQTESNTLSGVAEKLGGEQNPLYYMPVTERQTLTEAVNRVQADGVGEMERLADKEHWSAADVDTAMTLYGKLQADGVQNRDFGAAQSWAKVIQARGTSTAQALQAFSKWTRSGSGTASAVQQQLADSVAEHEASGGRRGISQEQADTISNDVYNFAQEFDSLGENDAVGLRDLIRRMSDYRKTGTLVKKNFAKVLDKITDADYLREFALRQMSAIADDATVQADLGQKLKTWQTLAQLLRLPTFKRNIGGNLSFGTLDTLVGDSLGLALDHLAGKFSGKREVGFDKGWFSSKARKAAVDALNRSVLEVAGDIDMSGDMNRYGRTSSRTFKMTGTPLERTLSRLEQILSYSLTTSDKVFRGKTEAAQTEALEGIKENAPTKEGAADIAKATADYRLFQNKGTAYGISKGIHDIFNLAGIGGTVDKANPQRGRQGGFGLGDVVNTYPGVPANLGAKLLEYSPANIAKGAAEFAKVLKDIKYGNYQAGAQNKAVMDMARGLAGVPILTALAAAFKTGLIKNWDDEDDLDAAAQNRAEGKTGVQINLDGIIRAAQGEDPEWRDGDDVMSVSWLEPLNAFLAVSSLLAADDSDDPAVSKYMKHTFNGAIQSVLDLPVMENVSNLVDTFKYSTADNTADKVMEAATGLAGDALTGMIPGVSGQLARTIDPYYRDVTGDSEVQRVWNSVKNVVPSLRETLPVKLDNYGEPKMAPDSAVQRALNNFFLPGAINQIRQSDVSSAINSLYEATGDANVVPDRKAPNSINVNGEKYTLTAEEKRDYQETYGNAFADSADRLLNTDEFAGLSDETKAEAMKKLEQLADYQAKKDYLKQQGVDYSVSANEKILALADEDPDEAVRYLTTREAITAATEDRDYDVLDQLLGNDGAYHNLGEEAQEMLSSIDGLKRLVSMRDDGVSAENAMKAIDAIKGLDKQDEQTAAIVGLDDMSDTDKIKALKSCTSESYAEKVKTAYDSGVSLEEWSRVYAARQQIDKGEGTAQNKATDFAAWLDKNTNLTAAQKDVVQDQLSFYSMNKAEPTHYDGLRESKVDEDTARRIANTMTKIQPPEGKTQATQEQKVDTILGMGLSDGDTWAALKEYTSESWYNKAAEAYRKGIDLDDYVRQFREADLPNDKGETNGQLSQDELWKYYKANPNNETFVKVMWLIAGFKTDWATYKRKHK